MEGTENKGFVCVTGGTGYLASWLIMKLLQRGYSVRATIRSDHNGSRDISFLTNLPGAAERLQIFNADLDKPGSFNAAIEGCIGVFHVAHPVDLEGREPEETVTRRSISGTLSILQACLNSKTVKRVVYTSSASTVLSHNKNLDVVDENTWTDVDYVKGLNIRGAGYVISKTLTERAVLEFAEKNHLDLVTVIPTYIHGPFVTPQCPGSVHTSMALIFGDKDHYGFLGAAPVVHVDDVADAHIFLFEYPHSKGRYNCSAKEITIDKLSDFLSSRYPAYQVPTPDSLKEFEIPKYSSLSSKKLLDTGFKFKYGLEEMFDDAIRCCKEKGLL